MDPLKRMVDPSVVADPMSWLVKAFGALSPDCLLNLKEHVGGLTRILCGSYYRVDGRKLFSASCHYDPALLAVRSHVDAMTSSLPGAHWDTYATYKAMMTATGGAYDDAMAHATPSEVRRAVLIVLQESGLNMVCAECHKEVEGDPVQEEDREEEACRCEEEEEDGIEESCAQEG